MLVAATLLPAAAAEPICDNEHPTPPCVGPATGGAIGACAHTAPLYTTPWCVYEHQREGDDCIFASYGGVEREVVCASDAHEADPLCADMPDPPCVGPIAGTDALGTCVWATGFTCAYVTIDPENRACLWYVDGAQGRPLVCT